MPASPVASINATMCTELGSSVAIVSPVPTPRARRPCTMRCASAATSPYVCSLWSTSMTAMRSGSASAMFQKPSLVTCSALTLRDVAHDLVRSGRQEGMVVLELVPLLGVLDQRVHATGDRVARRLVAGHREQHEERVELELGEDIAFLVGLEQPRDDVVLRFLTLLLRELVRVHEHLHGRAVCLFRSHAVLRVIRADHAVGPVEDLVPVLERHAHEVSNQDQRQLGRAQRDEVALTLLYRVVDDLAADLVDALLELTDHSRSEATVDQAACPGVV